MIGLQIVCKRLLIKVTIWVLILVGFAMLGATFNLDTHIGLPYIVGTLKDSSLQLNSLAVHKFSATETSFQNGTKDLPT